MTDGTPAIVLAEDDRATRELLTRQLTNAGYEVLPCENGRIALEAVCSCGLCTVLADWNMPEMNGIELCRALQDLRAMNAIQFVYVVILTAHSEKERIVEALEAGADDYLTKPYNRQELLARLRVGRRMMALQEEITHRQLDLHKVNAQMAVLNHKLEKLANTDALTELFNRRRTFERLHEVWELGRLRNKPFGCIMLDVDHFKQFNDRHGHAVGDRVLKAVAATCRRVARGQDTVGRFGGEEFIVLCPDTDPQTLAALGEQIRTAIEQTPVECDSGPLRVTASIGVAPGFERTKNADAMVCDADQMLYAAKKHGRNQVWFIDEHGIDHRYVPRDSAALADSD